MAYEAGARFDLGGDWSLDLVGYYNKYRQLTVPTVTTTIPLYQDPIPYPLGIQLNSEFMGRGRAETWGGEATLSGHVKRWWKLVLTYSNFNSHVPVDPLTGAPYALLAPVDSSPRHQVSLTNTFDIDSAWSVNSQLRHVSRLPAGSVPAYTALDLRVSYRIPNGAEFSLVGTDLLKARHAEFIQPYYPIPLTYVPRTISAQLRYRF